MVYKNSEMDSKEHQYELMVNEHKRTIYTVCYMFSNDTAQVEDYFQEILIRLWLGFDSFRNESNPRTWIYRVSLNTCLNLEHKKLRQVPTVPLSVDIDPYHDSDPDTLQIRQLHQLINRLDILDRALVLLWLEGISYEEIGAIMGISAKNVSVRLVRIKAQLIQMK